MVQTYQRLGARLRAREPTGTDELGADLADVEVQGVLCFVGCEWGWIRRTKRVNGVTALWPTSLPDHVSVAGSLAVRVTEIADRLRSELRPAT